MSVLRVLYVAPSIPVPGFHGGSTHVLELSRNLVKLGCNVVVLARRLPGQPQFEIMDGVKVFRIWRGLFKPVSTDSSSIVVSPALEGLKLLEKVYFNTVYLAFTSSVALYLARKYKVDVILERGDSYGASAIASLITGIPLITEIRGIYQPRISLRVAKKLLVYDPSILRDKRFLFKVAIMHGGVDVKRFKPMPKQDAKTSLGLSGKFVIGYSGSSMRSHKLGVMVTLAEKLQKTYGGRVHFLVIGPRDRMLLKAITALGLEHSFSFVGPVPHDELPGNINAMDVGLAIYDPKKVAGPPYKVYEYMACGIPAITTETIYSRRMLRDGLNGFLVKANDYEDVLRKISLLIEDPKLLHEMSVKARETALKLSWEKEAERILKLLMSCCENSGDGPRRRRG
jgi:glycosyltransferase involved in cell wall biosynthesis